MWGNKECTLLLDGSGGHEHKVPLHNKCYKSLLPQGKKKKKEEGNVSVELWRMGLYFVLTQKFWMFPIQINGDRYT